MSFPWLILINYAILIDDSMYISSRPTLIIAVVIVALHCISRIDRDSREKYYNNRKIEKLKIEKRKKFMEEFEKERLARKP